MSTMQTTQQSQETKARLAPIDTALANSSSVPVTTSPLTPETPNTPTDSVFDTEPLPRTPAQLREPAEITVNGAIIDSNVLHDMAKELAEARATGEFPQTTTPVYEVKATVDDHARLMQLRAVRGDLPRSEWRTSREAVRLLVNISRDIRDRDEAHAENSADNNVRSRVERLAQGAKGEAAIYQLMRHAVNSVINSGEAKTSIRTTDAHIGKVLNEIRDMVKGQAERGVHGVTEENMEKVLEEVFKMIEYALLDAAGPIRLNAKHLQGQNDRLDGANGRYADENDRFTMQVNAITGHVGAIDNHVHSLGSNINSLGHLLTSTSNNVQAASGNVTALQTVINMLPQLIAQAIQERLPEILRANIQAALTDALTSQVLMAAGGSRVPTKKVGIFKKFTNLFKSKKCGVSGRTI
ncbi:hypothetical protein F4780DRAFT_234367 [Xylariomycetidae sp. FL0641]|nr:hypothetical protein F4780DRAFT_234367 [Xylariomycetidae sp. FL0641]